MSSLFSKMVSKFFRKQYARVKRNSWVSYRKKAGEKFVKQWNAAKKIQRHVRGMIARPSFRRKAIQSRPFVTFARSGRKYWSR